MKLWSGRFGKDTNALVNELNASIAFDQRLYREDITGSMAHAAMLAGQGIISQADADAIQTGLQAILEDVEAGKIAFTADNEDIHMNVEALLTARIGDAGKRLHTARSRNDQVALDFRMYVREQIPVIVGQLLELETVLCRQAKQYQTAVMPGYTHLQRAQPISFAQHLLAYASMFSRDVTRLEDCAARLNECPLGSGALAGTTYPIDRFMTAQALGFAGPMSNSLDGVSDRDYALELLSALSILMMHLSRFSEEIILWCSWEFKFIELDDGYATGSSIMPQKKNPDVAELVRGKTGRVYGDLMGLLTVMKGLPLAYNKDMQEDKEPVFDAVDTVEMCLPVFAAMLDTMTVHTGNMRAAAGKGFINATDCADYLTKKGMPFRDAYTVTGKLVAACTAQGKTLEELSLEELKAASDLFDEDVYEAINLENCMALRGSYGGPAVSETTRQIQAVEQFIQDHTK
nr:argininosuccinate lyase [uncultured Dysosmobacter sp.]